MIAPKTITLTIDGQKCEGHVGQTILEIASASKIYIPTLCYLKNLTQWGGCRMCVVEIKGSPKIVPACSTPATDGSTIITTSERLQRLRRMTLELLFSERNHICPICPMNAGDCGLQHQGYLHGVESVRFPYLYPSLPVDLSGKYFGLDHNRCILCTRCVRTCDEVEGVHTLDISNRGEKNQVVVDLNVAFGDSETCTNCGACVAACPTGALFDKAAAFRGKLNSCQTVKTTCAECPIGCGLLVYTKDNRIVDVFGDPEASINTGHLCRRGRYETWAEPHERIRQPLLRRNGKLEPVSWDEALRFVRQVVSTSPQWQGGLLVTPRLTNETARAAHRWEGKFDRVGTFVARNEAAICVAPEKSADVPRQLETADAYILIGVHPSRDHGVLAARIRAGVRKRGAKLLIFHTRRSALDAHADVLANVVSTDRKFWKRVTEVLQDAKQPVLLYGPDAMTPIGVTVLERLIDVFSRKKTGQPPAQIALPTSANSLGVAAAGIEPVEDVAPWLDAKPLHFLHVIAGDEPDGGARLLEEKYVQPLLEQIDCLVVQASYVSPLTAMAQVVLPALTWAEKAGTITNFEGRTLPLRPVLPVQAGGRDDQEILEALYA